MKKGLYWSEYHQQFYFYDGKDLWKFWTEEKQEVIVLETAFHYSIKNISDKPIYINAKQADFPENDSVRIKPYNSLQLYKSHFDQQDIYACGEKVDGFTKSAKTLFEFKSFKPTYLGDADFGINQFVKDYP